MKSDKPKSRELFNQKKLTLGVLLGGISSERTISIKSGSAVAKALKSLAYTVKTIDINKPSIQALNTQQIDIAFIALHGNFGENGEIQRLLEKKNIIYTGSGPAASRQALDKVISKEIFIKASILTPSYQTINQSQSLTAIKDLTYPVVIKPRTQGSSVGVSIVKKAPELRPALEESFKYEPEALIEKYVSGREVTVAVLGENALPVVELKPKEEFYNYRAKYEDELTEYIINPDLPASVLQEIQTIGLRAHQALGCRGFSRVDMIYAESGEIFVLEVNSIPGLTERSLLPKAAQVIGIEFPQLCERIIELALS